MRYGNLNTRANVSDLKSNTKGNVSNTFLKVRDENDFKPVRIFFFLAKLFILLTNKYDLSII